MEYRTLGRTGLSVSVMGLGCGGHSRLGLSQNRGEENAIRIVRHAVEAGINFIDTAEAYGTEEVVGKALEARETPRSSVILSTKVSPRQPGGEKMRTRPQLREAVEGCLTRLKTERVDILHLHGVSAKEYDYCVGELTPELEALRSEGKIRFIGITEAFAPDPGHAMLQKAVLDDCWEVMMVGFNLINQSARSRVLSVTQRKNIGILNMFAVRRALSDPEALKTLVQDLVSQGLMSGEHIDHEDPLGFLREQAESIPDAAYRFCREEPGIHVVLSGTGNIEHLEANIRSLARPALPDEIVSRLKALFVRVDNVSGN